MSSVPLSSRAGSPAALDGGFSLVELLVALGILVAVLTASAASLITFSQTALQNERRVQTTAQLGAAHERLQGIPWERAGVYFEEVKALASLGIVEDLVFDEINDVYTFEGEELVLLPGPDCSDSACRLDFVPLAYEADLVVDDRSYEMMQLVTEVDRTGDGEPDIRRFYTLAQWQVRDRAFEQSFVSDRAPTLNERQSLEAPPVRQFLVTPAPIEAIGTGTVTLPDDTETFERVQNDEEISIAARFSRGVAQADVCFFDAADFDEEGAGAFDPDGFTPADCDTPGNSQFTMSGVLADDGGLNSGFELTIEPGDLRFSDPALIEAFVADGGRAIKAVLIGYEGGDDYLISDADLFLTDLDLSGGPTMSSFPANSVFVESNLVDVNEELCDSFTIGVIADADLAGNVELYFSDRSRGLGAPGLVTQPWTTVFEEGAVSPWVPTPGSDVKAYLYATATETLVVDDGGTDVDVLRTSPFLRSKLIEFRLPAEPGGRCP